MPKPRFSAASPSTTVILAHYQQAEWLAFQLAALASQTTHRFDVIVADDGSNPSARDIVAVQLRHFDQTYRRFRPADRTRTDCQVGDE